MRTFIMKSGIAIGLLALSFFLFFNAKNLVDNYSHSANSVRFAEKSLKKQIKMLNTIKSAFLDFNKKGGFQTLVKETGGATKGLLQGFGSFLNRQTTRYQKEQEEKVRLATLEQDRTMQWQELLNSFDKIPDPNVKLKIQNLANGWDDVKRKLEQNKGVQSLQSSSTQSLMGSSNAIKQGDVDKTKKVVEVLKEELQVQLKELEKRKQEMPSVFWQWFLFILAVVLTVIALCEVIWSPVQHNNPAQHNNYDYNYVN